MSAIAVAPAQAVVMNFESLAVNNSGVNNVGTTYTESGFTVSQVGTQPNPLGVWGTLAGLETFTFSGFTNLVSVDWSQDSPFHQFDNINVSAAGSTAVPEPFTVIGTLVGGTAALRMRKKLKSVSK